MKKWEMTYINQDGHKRISRGTCEGDLDLRWAEGDTGARNVLEISYVEVPPPATHHRHSSGDLCSDACWTE